LEVKKRKNKGKLEEIEAKENKMKGIEVMVHNGSNKEREWERKL
jgi:hypothetical protein